MPVSSISVVRSALPDLVTRSIPSRESSGSQFYIVWGSVYKPAQLKQMEKQMQQNR